MSFTCLIVIWQREVKATGACAPSIGDDRGRSVPGRLGRHRVVINPAIDFLAFRVCCGCAGGHISRYGASRGYQAIQRQTEQHRTIQSHSGPTTKPSCATSPPQRFSLGVALSPYFVHRSSSSSASSSCRRPRRARRPRRPHTPPPPPLSKAQDPKRSPQMPSIVAFVT